MVLLREPPSSISNGLLVVPTVTVEPQAINTSISKEALPIKINGYSNSSNVVTKETFLSSNSNPSGRKTSVSSTVLPLNDPSQGSTASEELLP